MAKWNSQTTIGGTAVAVDDLLLLSDQSQAAGSRDRNISVSDLSYATGRFSVGQTGHGLSVGDCVWFDGADYVEATADTKSNARVIGVIVEVIDVDNIVIQSTGFAFGLSGLSAGSTYYLQDAGGLGTSPGTVVVPVLLASSTSTGWLLFAAQNEPDVEEGTWTPAYDFHLGGSVTTIDTYGRYLRVGNLVSFWCRIATASLSSPNGYAYVSGLPFVSNSTTNYRAGVAIGAAVDFATSKTQLFAFVTDNNSIVYIADNTSNGTISYLSNTDFASGSGDNVLILGGSYATA